jgi:hypothetical protein
LLSAFGSFDGASCWLLYEGDKALGPKAYE